MEPVQMEKHRGKTKIFKVVLVFLNIISKVRSEMFCLTRSMVLPVQFKSW